MKCDKCMALCCNYTLFYAHLNGTYQGWGVIATTNDIMYQPPWTFRPSYYPRRLPIDTCLVSKKFYKSPLTNYGFGVAMGGLLLKLQNFKKVKLIFGHPVYATDYVYNCITRQVATIWIWVSLKQVLLCKYFDFTTKPLGHVTSCWLCTVWRRSLKSPERNRRHVQWVTAV